MGIRWLLLVTFGLGLAGGPGGSFASAPIPAHGVIGVDEAMLSADFWIARLPQPDRIVLDPTAIACENERLLREDASVYDLRGAAATLPRKRIRALIEGLSARPAPVLYRADGRRPRAATLDALVANRNVARVAGT